MSEAAEALAKVAALNPGYSSYDMLEVLIAIAKLLLGTFAFVLIGWLGARDKRIGGVLLTFPLLNGIAMLTGADPIGIAGTVYLIVVWNCILFLLAIYRYEWLPPLPASWDAEAKIIARSLCWVALWSVGATALAWFRDDLSSAHWLFFLQLAFAVLYLWHWWGASPSRPSPTFAAMWFNRQGLLRVAAFVLLFVALSMIAYLGKDARWVGWASALPLPGIFALAMLSVTQAKADLLSVADTVLLGPLLVIPFNGLLARVIVHLRTEQAGAIAEIATVIVFWALAAAVVFLFLPLFARWRDRLRVVAVEHPLPNKTEDL